MCAVQCSQKNTACQHIFALNQTTNHHNAPRNHRRSSIPPTISVHAVHVLCSLYTLTHMYVDWPCVLTYFVYAHGTRIWIYGKYQQDSSKNVNVNIVLQISEMEISHHTYNLFMHSSIDIARSVCVVGAYKGVYNRRAWIFAVCFSEM